MNSLEGQGADRGWFSRYFSNVLPLPVSLPQKVLWQTFGMAVRTVSSLWYNRCSAYPHDLPCSHACEPICC